jgi:hypothetical protein
VFSYLTFKFGPFLASLFVGLQFSFSQTPLLAIFASETLLRLRRPFWGAILCQPPTNHERRFFRNPLAEGFVEKYQMLNDIVELG